MGGGKDHGVGIAAIPVQAGEQGLLAKVLPARAAIPACAAGPMEPGGTGDLPDPEIRHAMAQGVHAADHLMPRHRARPLRFQVPFGDVQVGAADAAGDHLQADFAHAGFRKGFLDADQRMRF